MFFNGSGAKKRNDQTGKGGWRGPLPWKTRHRRIKPGAGVIPTLAASDGGSESVAGVDEAGGLPAVDHTEPDRHEDTAGVVDLRARIATASFAFRGYDVNNLGRSAELLEHPAYGPTVRRWLDEASAIASEALGRRLDLSTRVASRGPSSLDTFAEDLALIVAMELTQLALLEGFFGIRAADARQSFGYSIGEMASLVAGGVFTLEQLLPVPIGCADDCAALAPATTLGVLFSRGPALSLTRVQALCTEVSGEGRGMVGASAYLSPNTVLLIGEGDTLDRLEAAMSGYLPETAMLRRKAHKLPPLHTPLVWQKNIPNRAATALYKIPGRLKAPEPRVISCVTGAATYGPLTTRDTLIRWVDHPQLLWEAIDETFRSGVNTVIHAGPAPNLIPATFERLSNNVTKQLGRRYLKTIGHGVGSHMNRHAWLTRLLPSRAGLLRAPHVRHIILEDWLLEQKVP